ncbi:probable G-protein coupled receptor No18 [Antedon mediterranea]|uniref:probable G-protein coupled receptor No18 n=1 Tax=Antedon mediterranea TaxID=105859 RepID=UPI003AF91E3B
MDIMSTVSVWNNASQTTVEEENGMSPFFTIVLTLCLCLLAITGLLGNVLVIVAVCKTCKLRTATNWFIVSLACADLLVCVVIIPFAITLIAFGRWVLGTVMCYIWSSLDIMCCTASTLSLCAVSLDRYWAILTPLRYTSSMSFRRYRLMIMFVWIFSSALAMTQLLWVLLPETVTVSEEQCTYSNSKPFRLYSSAASFFIPISISVFLYCRIFSVARRQARRISIQENVRKPGRNSGQTDVIELQPNRHVSIITDVFHQIEHPQVGNTQTIDTKDSLPKRTVRRALSVISSDTGLILLKSRDWKALKTVVVVIGVFILCWVPFATTYVLEVFCLKCEFSSTLLSLVLWLGYANSVVNPVIYAFLNRPFRKAFKRLLFKKYRFGSNGSIPNDSNENKV